MPENRKVRKKAASRIAGRRDTRAPGSITKTKVFRQLPVALRMKLDRALLASVPGRHGVKPLIERFALEPYGITPAALLRYARLLHEAVRPAATSQVMSSLLGCLPDAQRQSLLEGSRVLLLSRVIRVLSEAGAESLSVNDMQRLASILKSMGDASSRGLRRSSPDISSANANSHNKEGFPEPGEALAESVRLLYGLPWPLEENTGASKVGRKA